MQWGDPVKRRPEDGHLQAKERTLKKTNSSGTLVLDCRPPQLWENKLRLSKPPSLWYFVYGSPSWLIRPQILHFTRLQYYRTMEMRRGTLQAKTWGQGQIGTKILPLAQHCCSLLWAVWLSRSPFPSLGPGVLLCGMGGCHRQNSPWLPHRLVLRTKWNDNAKKVLPKCKIWGNSYCHCHVQKCSYNSEGSVPEYFRKSNELL